MKNILTLLLCGAALLIAGCSTVPKSDLSALQGTWKGHIGQGNDATPCQFVVSGSNFDFQTDDHKVWYKGTLSLREDTTPRLCVALIRECPFAQYIGKRSLAIYRVEKSGLTMTGNEPGKTEAPTAFDAPGSARMELKRQ